MSGINIEGTLSAEYVTMPVDSLGGEWQRERVAHVAAVLREQIEGALAEAWEEGAFYYGGDPAEHWYFSGGGLDENPYRAAHLSDTERAGGAG